MALEPNVLRAVYKGAESRLLDRPRRCRLTNLVPCAGHDRYGASTCQEVVVGYAAIADLVPSMAMKLLFVVEHAFQIAGRGCVLAPGLAAATGGPVVKVGSTIRLELGDGSVRDTYVKGIEMLNYGSRPRPAVHTVPILLPNDLKKDDVPPGTRVFLLSD